ncbi:MAG: hypothetical protein D6812_12335 [Deltaproteobacteria bacterium]|nr:MAG: hypothetical protein D6812_12335 [Deltaproteobacteria bacterium]
MGIRDLRLVETFRSPDTRELATHWIETHLPPGSRILVESNGNYGPTVREEIFQPVPLEFHPTRRAPTVSDLLAGEIDAVVTTELYRPLDDGRFSAMLDHTPCIQEIQRFPGPYLPELFRNPEIRVYAVDRICLATTDPPGTETNRHGSGADPLGLGKKEGYEKNASFVPFRASKKVEIR